MSHRGYTAIAVLLAAFAGAVYWLVQSAQPYNTAGIISASVIMTVLIVLACGFFMVQPNEARVLQLFGAYVGTAREAGLRWANPFYSIKGGVSSSSKL